MAIDIYRPTDSFSGVGKNQTATVTLPGGVVYDALHLEYNADANFDASKITGIRLNLNGEDIIDVKGTDLVDVEKYKGRDEVAGFLTIQLAEMLANTFDGKHSYGLITSGRDAISLEVDIGDTGATAPALSAFSTSRPVPRSKEGAPLLRKFIPKMKRYTGNASAAGDYEIHTLPRRPDVRYKRVYFQGANITKLTVERDQQKIYELTKARNEYIQKRHEKVAVADTFVFDPIVDGYALAKAFPTASNSLVFRLAMSNAGKADALVESVWIESMPR